MKDHWNKRFKADEYIYGIQPNEFFAETLTNLKPGTLLLPGEGEGRNAVWAAQNGWDVTAVDYSEAGRNKALKLAIQSNVQLSEYIISDLKDYIAKPGSYDAIALIYIHMDPVLRQKVHPMLANALKPGGILILEAFNKEQIKHNSGGPKNVELLYSTDIIAKDFETLRIKYLENYSNKLSEGILHNGNAKLVRMIATK